MSDLDSLSIQITSDSKKAEDAIEGLIRGLTNLNDALGNLDVSKITAFSNAVSKLSNIGSNTNATSKAIKSMAREISDTFGIKSKKGINDLTASLQNLYDTSKKYGDDFGDESANAIWNARQGVSKAIQDNYKYKESIDSTTKSIRDYVNVTNKSGTKVGMADMVKEFGEDFKEMRKVLGSTFNNDLKANQEGVQDLAEYLAEMNYQLGTQFDTDNVEKGFQQLVDHLKNAKAAILDFQEASEKGLINETVVDSASDKALTKISELLKEQSKYGATSGLSGVASAFERIGNANIPNIEGAATALKNVQKVITETSQKAPDIKNISTATDVVKQSFDNAASSAANFSRSLVGIRNSKRVIEGARANIGDLAPVERGFVITEDVKQLRAVIQDYSKYAEEAYNKIQALANKTGEAAETLENGVSDENMLTKSQEAADKAKTTIEEAIEKAKEYKQVISEMESGKRAFDPQQYEDAIKGYDQATKKIQEYKKSLTGGTEKPTVTEGVLPQLVVLGKELGELSHKFGELGNKAIGLFKVMVKPLQWASGEYVEKFRGMQETIQNFQMKFRASMKKVSDFWKRTMRTFTFMIVRKAIDAVVKEVGTAIQSLAMYSNAMGTAFNTDLSNMVADFQYLGRSIVSVFAPLLNYIAPIIDAIVDKIATLISYIGMLFAALGGSTSFTKAKKNVGNYAESLDNASKSAKNLTMGIDELNIISDQKSGGSAKPYDGWEDAWEDVEIPDWIKDLADWFKKLWDAFFAPLKEAWDRAKQYIEDGFKTMVNSLKKLLSDIGRDFLEVWNQEKTIHMFETIFRIIGDIFRVVRNLANAFDEAWNYNRTGFHILENIRDIMYILVEHARNISYYMIGWAKEIDFKPLLTAFENLTNKAKKLADFLGGVVEDIFVLGILKYIKWMIEEGLPHLQRTIAEIIELINFATLRERLKPLWSAIEELLENIHKGVTNAIGNIGKALARFVNSSQFNEFLQTLVKLAKQITAARVEKVLTGLGKGILEIAKAVVKFVNSDLFQNFIEFIGDWIDSHSSDDIANLLLNVAKAILAFKFGEFALSKLSGVFQFFSVLTAMTNLANIASDLGHLSGRIKDVGETAPLLETVGGAFTKLGGVVGNVFKGIGTVLTSAKNQLIYFLTEVSTDRQVIELFKKDFSTLGETIKTAISGGITAINDFSASLPPLVRVIGTVATAFLEWKVVGDSAKDLAHAINGDGDSTIGGSILGLVAKIGVASAAFTAFLGFPAGLVAGLVVGGISAIKHFQDAVNEINFDHMLKAAMTTGDTTIKEVTSWYDKVTEKISESAHEWKEIERNLTQDRADINEYAKSIEGIATAWKVGSKGIEGAVGKMVGLYEDLNSAIDNYIDESTDALVRSILAQKKHLEAQGVNVNQMIHDIYAKAESEKKLVDDAVNHVAELEKEYQSIVSEFGADSDEAIAKAKEIDKALDDAANATSKWIDTTKDIDMTDAAAEIAKLGKSLDLSQYGTDWATAASDMESGINEINTKFTTAMSDLNSELETKMGIYDKALEDGFITNAQYQQLSYEAQSQFRKATDELTTATTGALDVYSRTLSDKLVSVAEKASYDWDNNIDNVWTTNLGKDKNAYIISQIKDYAEMLTGSEGLAGALSEAYASVPGAVDPDVINAIQQIVDSEESYYNSLVDQRVDTMKGQTLDVYQNVLNFVDGIDYETPMGTYAERTFNAAYAHLQGQDFDSLGQLWSSSSGNALISNSTVFEDANRLVAGEGSAAFSDEYVAFLDTNMTIIQAMQNAGITAVDSFNESAVGQVTVNNSLPDTLGEYGTNAAESFNTKFEEETKNTEPIITNWFRNIDSWIHNNSFLPFGSPNKKTQEYGKDLVTGLNLGITTNATTTLTAIDTWFTYIQTSLTNKLNEVKTLFNTMLTDIFSGNGWDYITPISTLFMNITTAVNDNIILLGETLLNEILPMFMETYIVPFFSIDLWQPYFDILLNEVFMVSFENFLVWFDEQMNAWWTDHMVIWFEASKWNKDLFDPVKKNYTDRYKNFILWFDKSIKDWWENKLMPYFKVAFWNNKIFDPLKQNRETHYQTFITWFDRSIKDWWENKLMPYFKVTFWNEKIYEPLKQNREKHYKNFTDWFDKSIKDWWENKLMPYLKVSFWDSEIFNPLKESIQTHFTNFVSWWILSMNLWWTADVIPYFTQDRWQEQFDHIKVVAEAVFSYIEKFITENINKAKDSVVNACNEMVESLSDVLSRLHEIEETLERLQAMGFDIGNFEMGGFPNEGSLFFAGERGAELIGSVNGRTAVTSNDEITGIRQAIAESGNQEAAYLSQLIALTTQLLDKEPVVIGDRDIAEMAESGKSMLGMQIIT